MVALAVQMTQRPGLLVLEGEISKQGTSSGAKRQTNSGE